MLAEDGFIRCGICRGDLKRHVDDLRKERAGKGLCPACGRPKLEVSPRCHDHAFGGLDKDLIESDPHTWIPWISDLVKKHRRLLMRLLIHEHFMRHPER
jgi:hypothetical protein